MTKFYLKKDFINLRNFWYKKLKENGFNDKEVLFINEPVLMQYEYTRMATSKLKYDKFTANRIDEYRQYYVICENYLENGKFESENHKKIFYYHVNGMNVRAISDKIMSDDSFYQKFKKTKIHKIINYYASKALGSLK